MITVNEAKSIVRHNIKVLPPVTIPITDAFDHVLAEDVLSKIDFPPFNQSNVDGYAIAFRDASERLIINGKVTAGDNEHLTLKPLHAIRIFTGAAVPSNADTVVMQEKVVVEKDSLIVTDQQLREGLNFRPRGKDMQQGALAMKKNEYLSAGAIGFLSALGITEVIAYKKPFISIIITGNELGQPGKELNYGQVYEANSFMLKAALQHLRYNDIQVLYAEDDLQQLTSTLGAALEPSDLVLLCGGISVGDYDFVLQAAMDCGVEKLFHKVKQRPGNPLYFGKKENKIVFGLPGNPSSVLTCFYEYVVDGLALMTNKTNPLRIIKSPLANDYKKISGLTVFLKGLLVDGTVTALDAQESYRLSSYAKANCLIRLEENETEFQKGDVVEVHLLP